MKNNDFHLDQSACSEECPHVVWLRKTTPGQANQTCLKLFVLSTFPKMINNTPRHSWFSNQRFLVLEETAGEWQWRCPVLPPHWFRDFLATMCDAFQTFWPNFSAYLSLCLLNRGWIANNLQFLICQKQKHRNSCCRCLEYVQQQQSSFILGCARTPSENWLSNKF